MIDPAERPSAEQPLTKSMFAYRELRRRILDGELAPGERLLLRPLAEQLNLSVMPVRDALRLLERDGLVQSESHRGSTVTPIAADTVVELIGIRMWLEVLAVREVTPLHDDASLALVRERLDEAEAVAAGEPMAFAQANRAFHEAVEAPAAPELRAMIVDAWDRAWQARRRSTLYILVPDVRPEAQREHRALLAALEARDADAAAAAMAAHRDSTLVAWRTGLRDAPGTASRG